MWILMMNGIYGQSDVTDCFRFFPEHRVIAAHEQMDSVVARIEL